MKEWVTLGTPAMKRARNRKGLSYESAARLLHVSSKTYERYEKKGRVPVELVEQVAAVLDLEIEQPARERLALPASAGDVASRTLAAIEDVQARVGRIEQLLGESGAPLRADPAPPGSRRARP